MISKGDLAPPGSKCGERRKCDKKGLKIGLRRLDSEQGGNRKLFKVFHRRHGLIILLF